MGRIQTDLSVLPLSGPALASEGWLCLALLTLTAVRAFLPAAPDPGQHRTPPRPALLTGAKRRQPAESWSSSGLASVLLHHPKRGTDLSTAWGALARCLFKRAGNPTVTRLRRCQGCGQGGRTRPSSPEPTSPRFLKHLSVQKPPCPPWPGSPSKGLKLLLGERPHPCSRGNETCSRTVPDWEK